MRIRMAFAVAACAAGVLLAAAPGSAQVRNFTPVTDAVLQDPDPADWLNWRRTLDGWGHSPLDEIDTGNVGELQLAWSWGIEQGVSQTTPLVYDGVMYIANPGNVVHALDAASGDLIWEYRHEMDEARRAAAQLRNLAIFEDLILVNTVDAHTVALDARTGDVRWDATVGAEGEGYRFTSGPIVADGAVISGLTGCGRFREDTCYIVGLDARTGRELWRTSTVALPGERGGDTWGDLPVLFRAGSDAWIPGSYDPATKLIYWGTAQAKPWSRAARRTDGDALYSNSTLALNLESGELEWYYQHLPGESHDMDETFERVLIDYDGRQSVFSMGKLGILWELDRATGQFVSAVDLGYQNLVDVDLDTGAVTYRDGMIQEVGELIHICPSTGGFKSLRAMSYHPDTEAFYIPLNLHCMTAAFLDVERREGGGGTGGLRERKYHYHPDSPDDLGELAVVSIRSGETLWSRRRPTPYNTAALTTAGGVVFIGDWDRYFFAYDARTGDQLWQTRLPTLANGFPITYAVDGKQYVALGAGPSVGASSWSTLIPLDLLPDKRNPRAGNGIYVFALP